MHQSIFLSKTKSINTLIIEEINWFIWIFSPYIRKANVVITPLNKHKNVWRYACCSNRADEEMLLRVKSGIDVITLNDGHKKINSTKPMNLKCNVKYFYFYYSMALSPNFSFLIGIDMMYPNKNEVITAPPVIAVIPTLNQKIPLYYMVQLSAKPKTCTIASKKSCVILSNPAN